MFDAVEQLLAAAQINLAVENFLLQVRQGNIVVLQLSKQQIKSLHGFFVAQAFGILSSRINAITVLFVDLALAHQEVVLGSLRWI